MATWKKVLVSGSSANLSSLQVDNLALGQVVIGGGQGGNLSTTAINGGGNLVATTGSTGLSHSGSFSGSFSGQITTALNNQATAYYVAYNSASGQFTYSGTGSFSSNSSSYASTASWALNFITSSVTSASYAATASYFLTSSVTNATSASYASTASWALNFLTSSVTSASYAATASYHFTSSVTNATSASYAATASYFITSSVTSASYASTASYLANGATASYSLTASYARLVGAGALISSITDIVSVVTSSLGTGQIPKYINNILSGSNITDTGAQVQIAAAASSGLSVAAGGISVTGNSSFINNVSILGDLTVAGTASFQNTQNLLIGDRFAALASGSTTLTDGGIIVVSSTTTNGGMSGSAFYLESISAGSYGRWAVAANVHASASTVTVDEYAVTAKINQASNPIDATPPTWGSSTNGMGNLWITNTGDIYIYS